MKKCNSTSAKTSTELKKEAMQLDFDTLPESYRTIAYHIFLSKLISDFKIMQFTLFQPYSLNSCFNNYQKQGSSLPHKYPHLSFRPDCSYHPSIKALPSSLSHLQVLGGHWSHLPAYPGAKIMSVAVVDWGKQQCNLAFLTLNKLQADANCPGRVAGNWGV